MSKTDQAIRELNQLDMDDLDAKRAWVRGCFTGNAEEKYAPIEGKLRVIDAILANGWVQQSETVKLQSLGVTFGDAIAQKLLMEWVVVEDEMGSTAALRWPGTSIICYPITMISKRVEDGENIDVHDLFENVTRRLSEHAFSGRWV